MKSMKILVIAISIIVMFYANAANSQLSESELSDVDREENAAPPQDRTQKLNPESITWSKSIRGVTEGWIKPYSRGEHVLTEEQKNLLRFEDTPISQVLLTIADIADLNLIVSDSVQGRLSVNRQLPENITGYEALLLEAKYHNLMLCNSGDLIHIAKRGGMECQIPYVGERLSLNFQSIEIKSLLTLVGEFSEQSIAVCSLNDVKMSIRLKNVRWDQAFDSILVAGELVVGRRYDDVLIVSDRDVKKCDTVYILTP